MAYRGLHWAFALSLLLAEDLNLEPNDVTITVAGLDCLPAQDYQAGLQRLPVASSLGDERLRMMGEHDTVAAWGVHNEYAFTILLVNQAMPQQTIHTELVELVLTNTTEPLSAFVERIDQEHPNHQKAWSEMGQPEYLSEYEVDSLKVGSELDKEPLEWTYDRGVERLHLSLPSQSVAAVTLELGVEGMQNVATKAENQETE